MRRSLVIGVAVVAVVGLAAAAYLYWYQPQVQPVAVNTNVAAPNPTPTTPVTPTPPTDAATAAKVAAMMFAERFGSYSSDQPFQNLLTLTPYVTQAFQGRLQSLMGPVNPTASFYSVTTKAILGTVEATTSEGAQVMVAAQRSERFDRTSAPRVSYQTLRVSLAKSGQAWLVDNASWGQ